MAKKSMKQEPRDLAAEWARTLEDLEAAGVVVSQANKAKSAVMQRLAEIRGALAGLVPVDSRLAYPIGDDRIVVVTVTAASRLGDPPQADCELVRLAGEDE